MKYLFGEAWTEEIIEDMTMATKRRAASSPKECQDLGTHVQPGQKIAQKFGRTYAEGSQSVVADANTDLHEQ